MKPIPLTQSRRFVRRVVLFSCLFPLMLITLNYQVDPNCRHSFSVPNPTLRKLANSEDLVLSMPANYDDRALLKKFIPQAVPPDIVVLGGSRILNAQAEFFQEPWSKKMLNVGVTAGTMRDYVALWEIIEQQGFHPKVVFVCVEEQSLNSASQNDHYLSIYEYYTAFYAQGISLRPKLQGLTASLKDLLSFETTFASLKLLLASEARNAGGRLMSRTHYDKRLPVRTHSFSMLYPATEEETSSEIAAAQGRANGMGEVRVFERWNRTDTQGYDHLRALLRRITHAGAKPVLVGMPYHPEAYRTLRQTPIPYANMLYFVEALKKIALSESIFFYDAIETHHNNFVPSDFLDGVHLKMSQNYHLFKDASRAANLLIARELDPAGIASDKAMALTGKNLS